MLYSMLLEAIIPGARNIHFKLSLIRTILRELAGHGSGIETSTKFMPWRRSPIYPYLADVIRSDGVHAVDQNLLQLYCSLLRNSRMSHELHLKYRGGGERSVEEVANMVGLKLPNQR